MTSPSGPLPAEVLDGNHDFTGREWLLRPLATWIESGPDRFFVLTGHQGTGKTAIAGWLLGAGPEPPGPDARALLRLIRESWSASYFCSRRMRFASPDPGDFSRSLARQLGSLRISASPAAGPAQAGGIAGRAEAEINFGTVNGVNIERMIIAGYSQLDAFAVSFRDPLVGYLTENPGKKVCILLDGLDEAEAFPSPNILDLVCDRLSGLPGNARILLSLRDDRRLLSRITQAFPDLRVLSLSEGAARANSVADVRLYVGRAPLDSAEAGRLASIADGNFLVARSLMQDRDPGSRDEQGSLPKSIGQHYMSVCSRLESISRLQGNSPETWPRHCLPLIGLLAVAFSSVPERTLCAWLNLPSHELRFAADAISQLVEHDRAGNSWKLIHGYLQTFFLTRVLDEVDENRFAFDEADIHERIVRYYLSGRRSDIDLYGSLYLASHVSRLVALRGMTAESAKYVIRLGDLVASRSFSQAVAGIGVEPSLRAQPYRITLPLLLNCRQLSALERVVVLLAASDDVHVRAAIAEVLLSYCAADQHRAISLLRELLSAGSQNSWMVGLQVSAAAGGPVAEWLFAWILEHGSDQVREAAPFALYAHWAALPSEQVLSLLRNLSGQVSAARLALSVRILEFVAIVCITLWINHCEDERLAEQISELWEIILVRRLHARFINRLFVDRMIMAPTFARHLARQVFGASAKLGLEVSRSLATSQEMENVVRRMVRFLDPATDPLGETADMWRLLESRRTIDRVLACQIIAIHCYCRWAAAAPWVQELYAGGSGSARIWITLAFGVLSPDAPAAWRAVIEDMTRRMLSDEPTFEAFRQWEAEALPDIDLCLLPLGLADGKASAPSAIWRELLGGDDAYLRRRSLQGIGLCGLYYPELALQLLRYSLGSPGSEPGGIVGALAEFYPLHPTLVDVFLQEESLDVLRPEVLAKADYRRVARIMNLVGHYNNGVNEAVRYPVMRVGMLEPVYLLLLSSQDEAEFLREYAKGTLRMLRDAKYRMIEWIRPAPTDS